MYVSSNANMAAVLEHREIRTGRHCGAALGDHGRAAIGFDGHAAASPSAQSVIRTVELDLQSNHSRECAHLAAD